MHPGVIIGNPVLYTGRLIVDESDEETLEYATVLSDEDSDIDSGYELE